MGFLDGALSASFPGFRSTATGAIASLSATLINPQTGTKPPGTGIALSVSVDNNQGTNSDLSIQVATDSGFTTIAWATTFTNLANGTCFAQPTGLTNGTLYYWRARIAPTSTTSWGPWSATWTFQPDANTGRAWGYITENIGIDPNLVYHGANEAITENIGFLDAMYAGDIEYLTENVGFEDVSSSDAVEEITENVDDTAPHIPDIWWFYLPYGFVGSEVQIWGQGFGTLQADFGAHVYLDPGPNHASADLELGITDWVVEVATAAAYGPDRRLYAGTDGAPPYSDAEYEVITVVIPEAGMPTIDQGAQADPIYVVHSQGTSNKPTWLYYPTIPTSLVTAAGEVRTGGMMRIAADPLSVNALIEQRMAHLISEAYLIAGGRAERAPLLSALSLTSAVAGTAASSNGLQPPADVTLGSTWRWLAAADHLSTTGWTPMVGTGLQLTSIDAASMPLLDASYTTASRIGDRAGSAMLFTGSQWLTSSQPTTGAEALGAITLQAGTIAMVAVLHANSDGPRSTLLSSYQGTGGGVDFMVSLDADQLFLRAGGARIAQHTITQVSGRPVIVVLAWDSLRADYFVLDAVLTTNHVAWPGSGLGTAQKGLRMGRPTTLTDGVDELARMELLDLAVWNSALPPAQIQAVVNQLDGIYGVSQ